MYFFRKWSLSYHCKNRRNRNRMYQFGKQFFFTPNQRTTASSFDFDIMNLGTRFI